MFEYRGLVSQLSQTPKNQNQENPVISAKSRQPTPSGRKIAFGDVKNTQKIHNGGKTNAPFKSNILQPFAKPSPIEPSTPLALPRNKTIIQPKQQTNPLWSNPQPLLPNDLQLSQAMLMMPSDSVIDRVLNAPLMPQTCTRDVFGKYMREPVENFPTFEMRELPQIDVSMPDLPELPEMGIDEFDAIFASPTF